MLGVVQVPADGLNEAQLEAVTHPGGPLLMLCGPGTGKTITLGERFAWLVGQGVPPGRVLALAFSRGAADDMRERLEASIDTPYDELSVSTFPRFAARLLRDEALDAGVDPFFAPVTQADRLAPPLERIDEPTLPHH